jgi:hypothetical protein
MSQLQGNSFINSNKASYWPGHVVAESLADENDLDDSIFEDETPKRKQSDQMKSRTGSVTSNQNQSQKLSRNSSQLSGGSISESVKNSRDFNNNNNHDISSQNGDQQKLKVINRQKNIKIKPGNFLF